MRLASATALLGIAIVLLAMGTETAEARRHYRTAGYRYSHPVHRRAALRSRRAARLAVQQRKAARTAERRAAEVSRPPTAPPHSDLPIAAVAMEPSTILAASMLPPPPGPVLVNSVTYDFEKGLKTTSLRDGATFTDTFDPKAFFRMVPETAPTTTSSTVAAAPGANRPD